ncbi:unnamed protein product [Mycena citricolor]|uniref:Zn(2)-C6 fungal-type domain-containing protein n=1 Tax=Mycena citricolor TaxID=2018698 RepID=A0AAD2HXQ3_9AGAR|nr:unnamed protein product [Mycena citricolor]
MAIPAPSFSMFPAPPFGLQRPGAGAVTPYDDQDHHHQTISALYGNIGGNIPYFAGTGSGYSPPQHQDQHRLHLHSHSHSHPYSPHHEQQQQQDHSYGLHAGSISPHEQPLPEVSYIPLFDKPGRSATMDSSEPSERDGVAEDVSSVDAMAVDGAGAPPDTAKPKAKRQAKGKGKTKAVEKEAKDAEMDELGDDSTGTADESASPSGKKGKTTATGKPSRRTTTSAVIACQQCRLRKIRCDSGRPHCSNCGRRSDKCIYDSAPKRRGPDKNPGTRQRRCKKRPGDESDDPPAKKKLKIDVSAASPTSTGPISASSTPAITLPSPVPVPIVPSAAAAAGPVPAGSSPDKSHGLEAGADVKKRKRSTLSLETEKRKSPGRVISTGPPERLYTPISAPSLPTYIRPSHAAPPLHISTDEALIRRTSQQPHSAPPHPSDRYISTPSSANPVYGYAQQHHLPYSFPRPSPFELGALGGEHYHPKFPPVSAAALASQEGWWDSFLRTYTLRDIARDLGDLYTESHIALSFVNLRELIERLWNRHLTFQPAFVLASLALAWLIRSSESDRGAAGRERAAYFRRLAQEKLEQAWRERIWLDASLAMAALILAQYEASAHPEYNPIRVVRALTFLDEIITGLGLSTFDSARPEVCRYPAHATPTVHVEGMEAPQCSCIPLGSPPPDLDTVGQSALQWEPSWTQSEIQDEECRRVVWAALTLTTSFRMECLALTRHDEGLMLSLCDPSNYQVLFPNEIYDRNRGTGTHPRNAIWALYCRSMLLCNFTSNVVAKDAETRDQRELQAEALQESWSEAQAIEDSLDAHVCNLNTAVSYLCRENIANSRLCIQKGLRGLQGLASPRASPLMNRRQAEEWIYYQLELIKRVTLSIQFDQRGTTPTNRPFALTWFYHQLSICLLLWEHDNGLITALNLAKAFLVPLDVMNALWPCEYIHSQCSALRKQLTLYCMQANLEPPPAELGSSTAV